MAYATEKRRRRAVVKKIFFDMDGEVDPDRLDGYIYIAAVFKYDLTWESMEGISALNGEKWIVLK